MGKDLIGNFFDNVTRPWENIGNILDPGELIPKEYDLWERFLGEDEEDSLLAAQNAAMESQLAIARDQYMRWEEDYKPTEQALAEQAAMAPSETFAQSVAPMMGAPKQQALQGLMTSQSYPATGLPKQTQGVGLRAAGNVVNRGITSAKANEVLKQPGRIESVLAPMLGVTSSAAGTLQDAGQIAGGLGRGELYKSAQEAQAAGQTAYGLTNYLAGSPWNTAGSSGLDPYMNFSGPTTAPSPYYNGIKGSSEYDQFF